MKKNEIVTVVNDFIDLPLKNFTPSEMNLLTTFLARCKNQHANLVEMEFSEIRDIANYSSRSNQALISDIANTNNKLQTLKFAIETDKGTYKQLVLFPTFEIDPNNKKLNIRVNEDFMYILNDLEFGFTSYEATIHNSLISKFSKQTFKQLRRFRSTGVWNVKQDKFRELLDVPEKYRQTDIDNRVLKPIKEELTPYFEGLEIQKTYKSSNRGRPAVSGYIFKWHAERQIPESFENLEIIDVEAKETTKASKEPAKKKRARKSGFKCPYCGEPLYLKSINGDDAPEVYLHLDGWKENARCKHIFNDISDIRKAETEVNFKSGPSTKGGSNKLSDILKDVAPKDAPKPKAKEAPKKEKDKRAQIIDAVPGLVTSHVTDLYMLIEAYKTTSQSGYGKDVALNKIKEKLLFLELAIENAGFDRDDLYTTVYKDPEIEEYRP